MLPSGTGQQPASSVKGGNPQPCGWQPLAVLRGAGQEPGSTPGCRAHPSGIPEPLSPELSLGAPRQPCPSRPRCHGRAAASCNGGGVKRRAAMVRSECHREPLHFASLPFPPQDPVPPLHDLTCSPAPIFPLPMLATPSPPPSPCPGSQPLLPLPSLLFTQLH